jgi:hypothetical protein
VVIPGIWEYRRGDQLLSFLMLIIKVDGHLLIYVVDAAIIIAKMKREGAPFELFTFE